MMKRRDFLKTIALGVIGTGFAPDVLAETVYSPPVSRSEEFDDHLKDYLHKMQYFNLPHNGDIQIDRIKYRTFESVVMRLRRLQQFVGHGNFHLLGFDDGISIAKNAAEIGEFARDELEFLEMIFYAEASHYGFFGQKPVIKLTDRISEDNTVKVPYTGNYIYRGEPFEIYQRIKQQVGDQVVLTSGVRSVMKQFLLFLNKAYTSNGNLSLASRSLAPPGYSYHGISDFDVGQVGFGALNFTASFTETEVYKKLSDLGYLKLRYPANNLLGVRFEPWHIKVAG